MHRETFCKNLRLFIIYNVIPHPLSPGDKSAEGVFSDLSPEDKLAKGVFSGLPPGDKLAEGVFSGLSPGDKPAEGVFSNLSPGDKPAEGVFSNLSPGDKIPPAGGGKCFGGVCIPFISLFTVIFDNTACKFRENNPIPANVKAKISRRRRIFIVFSHFAPRNIALFPKIP